MAHAFHRKGFVNVYATGAVAQHTVTLDRHFGAADLILVCNKPNLEEGFEREKHPDKSGLVRVHRIHRDRIIVCDTIGQDRWGDPLHPKLIERCDEFLSNLE